MLRRLGSILTIIAIVLLPFFFAPKTYATVMDDIDASIRDNSIDGKLQDFCKKRQGNQMNLETWYSGKCVDDSFSGEGVGFSDIVILDLAEKIVGKKDPDQTFSKTLKSIIDAVKTSSTPVEQKIALENGRKELVTNKNNGLIGESGKLIGLLYQNQPASTGSFIAYISQNLQRHKIIPQTLAATNPGVGFATFSPFLTIWIAFRNLAYLGLVVFFIVYGFMMMFRVNLGQKTVISVQLAIPKLIVTLLIITFSYAIVGLVYDVMWVVIYFITGYLTSQKLLIPDPIISPTNALLPTLASGNSPLGTIGSLAINMAMAGVSGMFSVLSLIFGGVVGTLISIIAFPFGGFLIMLIIQIAVLVSYGKLFFKLIGAFISIVVALITAPLVLLGNAFPGSKSIGTWFRNIVANLSVFPVTMLLLLFSYLLMVQPILGTCVDLGTGATDILVALAGGTGSTCETIFGVKNLVTSGNISITGVPLISPSAALGGFDGRGLLGLIGIGLLLMASKYVDIVRDALKVPAFKYGSDISAALQVPINMGKSALKAGEKIINLIK